MDKKQIGGIGGILILVGGFALFCAIPMSAAGIYRTYRSHRVARWIPTEAHVKKCALDVYHPFSGDGGGTRYSLICRLEYALASHPYEYRLWTTSDPSTEAQSSIDNWVAEHPPGTSLSIAVNPSDPHEAVVKSELPIHQFATANEAWITTAGLGAFGFLLTAVGRKLRNVPQ